MKKILYIWSFLLCANSFGQQTEHFTQYEFNQFVFNPAVAGSKNCIDIRTGYRFQWGGIDGAPQIGFFNIHAPLRFGKKNRNAFGPKHGIGGMIKRDAFGPYSNLKLDVDYAIRLPIGRSWTLSFGAAIGFMHTGFKAGELTTEVSDPAIPNTSQSFTTFPDGKVGLWVNDKKMYFGLAVHNLFGNQLEEIGSEAKLQRHLYITGGRSFSLEKGWSIIPSFLFLWTKNTPIDFHLSALADYKNRFTFGLGLRRTDAITAQVRVKLFNWISIGYSFDFVISKLNGNMWYSHELTGGFNSCSSYGNESTTVCPSFE